MAVEIAVIVSGIGHAQACPPGLAGRLPAQADPEQVGAVLFGMVPGYIMQRLLVGGVDPATCRAGLGALLTSG